MTLVIYEYARHCTSIARVIAFHIGHNYVNALWSKKFQNETFAKDPSTFTVGTTAPSFALTPTEGGYLADGLSRRNSGSSRRDSVINSGVVMVDGDPLGAKAFTILVGNVEMINNWDTAGMWERRSATADP